MNTMVCGSLALKPEGRRLALRVVEGGGTGLTVAPRHQLAAPDVYASVDARASSRRSIARSALGIAALCLALSLFIGGVGGLRASFRQGALEQVSLAEVSVLPGDSLWGIAEEHPVPGLTTAESVELIKEWNSLGNSTLRAGMELSVPLRD